MGRWFMGTQCMERNRLGGCASTTTSGRKRMGTWFVDSWRMGWHGLG